MENQRHMFHNQLAQNFVVLVGLVIGGWFLYYSFAPSMQVVQTQNESGTSNLVETAKKIGADGIYDGGIFRIRPPDGWAAGDAAAIKVAAIFINPTEDQSKKALFHSSINVMLEQTSLTLNAYAKSSKQTLEKSTKKYRSNEYKKTTVNGRNGYIIGGVFMQGNEQLRSRQLIVVEKDMAYIVTGTALDSAWSKYVEQINAALESFDL